MIELKALLTWDKAPASEDTRSVSVLRADLERSQWKDRKILPSPREVLRGLPQAPRAFAAPAPALGAIERWNDVNLVALVDGRIQVTQRLQFAYADASQAETVCAALSPAKRERALVRRKPIRVDVEVRTNAGGGALTLITVLPEA